VPDIKKFLDAEELEEIMMEEESDEELEELMSSLNLLKEKGDILTRVRGHLCSLERQE
jgi:hypothetical protein